MFDVVVIGGGVIGGTILRETQKYKLSACLLEKESDVAMGASCANSGIVHAGFDAAEGSLKAKFNLLGNLMMQSYAKELGVKYKNNGSLVVAFDEEEKATLTTLKERGEKNGVKGLKILNKEELFDKEPNISKEAVSALYAPTGGIVCPYKLTIAAIGNAMDNGAKLMTEFEVNKITKTPNGFLIESADGKSVEAKTVINCAGLAGGKIAKLFGDESVVINARRGEYILLDRECSGFTNSTLFFTPTKKGKGILVSPTVDGNIILGPTADEVDQKEVETTRLGLETVKQKATFMCPSVPLGSTITSFAGARAYSDRHDFIIEHSSIDKLINCVGIESPGLTSAPAIAKYVVEELLTKYFKLVVNENFNGTRVADDFFENLSIDEKNDIIKQNPSYGKIVCRCEKITEGEILRAIRTNPKATTVDGVKRRTRSGMGRCQGGFCQPQIVELIAKENGLELTEITKRGKGSNLLVGVSK